jgi:uncharacterized protein with NAD-binding domain and iron-sulfur cluster
VRDGSHKTRVAILGGGPAALAAAFELTATPALQARHEITIYQPGWRLGGKCASGRNLKVHRRIEEHGLHVWFGCYDNAFSIMRRCYASLGRDKRTEALPTWRHAFKPCYHVAVWDRGDDWQRHVLEFPPTPAEPGTEREREFGDVVREVLGWIERRMRKLVAEDDDVAAAVEAAPALGGDQVDAAARDVGIEVERPEYLGVTYLFEAAARLAERHLERNGALDDLETFAGLLGGFNGWVTEHLADALPGHADIRFLASTVDVVMAALKGILADGLVLKGFDSINDEELSDWLARHGASIDKEHPERNSAFLRGVYDGSFAFEDGDPLRPNMAAGRALQGAIRCLFHYNGAVLWRMQAGMGDAVIAPLYEVLRDRKVRFAFFHAVDEVRPTADGGRVGEVSIVQQVAMRDGGYKPLIDVGYDGKSLHCWPDRPLYKQLVGGRSQRVCQADFEHDVNPLGVRERKTLVAGDDFDVAILAVPPPVQTDMCKKLLERSPRYKTMVEGTDTVFTQAAQIWLDRTPQELGQGWDSNSLMSMFVEPLDTYCDMSHLLTGENWPARLDVRHIAYFCGVIPHEEVGEPPDPDAAAEAVHRHTRSFLELHARLFWPNAAHPRQQTGFDWARLVTPETSTATDRPKGTDRLISQYLRVNYQPSEQYVLTLAGSIDARLWPSERCFDNLVFAGDWTRNGFDAGCVEAAMTSGMLAAQAISGWPKRSTIAGLDGPTGFPNRPLGSDGDGDDDDDDGGLPFERCAERAVSGARQVAGRLLGLVR